ncbi:MAG: ABC transporter substrate-binding protein [Actinomycetia bacterium]|nr:ABC transporter substrate-binding protein [Actinomycetes bacterium]
MAVSCGSDSDDTATDTTEAGDDATDTTEADDSAPAGECTGEEITLRQFTGSVGQELELARASADRYESAHPCITIETIDTPDFVEDRLGVYLQLFEAQSSEGDVFQIDVIWPGDLAEHFVDLNEYGGAEAAAEHFPAIVENNTVDGKLVAIPWFTDAGLLYYRTDLLEKYDLDPPATWDELEAAAQTIQDGERAENPDFWGYVWQGNAYEGLTCDALEWIASADGGSIIEPDGTITINNQAAIDIVDQAAGWVGSISPAGVTAHGEEDARGIWQAGNAAFMRNWPYAFSLGNADDSEISGLFDVSPLPGVSSGNGAATLGGWQLAVSKYSDHPAEAAEYALFMASFEEQKVRAIDGSLNPTIEALYEDAEVLEAAPFFGSLFDVFTSAVARPSTITAPQYSDTSSLFFNAVHSVLTGDADAEEAFLELELDIQDLHPDLEVGAP